MHTTATVTEASGGPGRDAEVPNLYAGFLRTVERLGDDVALKSEEEGVELTWSQLEARVRAIAGGLGSIGVKRGDNVAMLLTTRSQFIPCDLAIVSLGAVPFSVYQTSSAEQIEYVLGDSAASVVITENDLLPQLLEAKKSLPLLEHVIVVDGEGGTGTLDELERVDPDFDPAPVAAETTLDDPLTLIYTSGTTGPPKGVVLTHGNLLRLLGVVPDILDLPERGARIVSWLPAAHIAERASNYYVPVYLGMEVNICRDPRRIIEVLPTVRPSWFFAVPRIWEKLKAGLEANLAGLPEDQREQAQAGLDAAIQKVRLEQAGEPVPDALAAGVAKADEALFSNLRVALGLDQASSISVGAAPIPLEVMEFFHAIGIEIGEVWGLSETCGLVTSNRPGRVRLGTVGEPLPGCDVKLAEDGELLCRSPYVMAEYRNQPEKTAETIIDGWFHTGDIGVIDEDGFVTIVDRKKELIINAAGKNMSPANIEAHVKAATPLVSQCVAIGDGRPYNVALISLDPDFTPAWAGQNEIGETDLEALAENEKVREAVEAGIGQANEKLSRVEQIKKFKIIPGEWLPGGDELTPTMKLKRKPISEKYEEEIEALYAG